MTNKRSASVLSLPSTIAILCGFLVLPASQVSAQYQPKRETIQATAMGQQRAAGKMFNVTVTIESYSTPEDQQMLSDAFKNGGNDASLKTLFPAQGAGERSSRRYQE